MHEVSEGRRGNNKKDLPTKPSQTQGPRAVAGDAMKAVAGDAMKAIATAVASPGTRHMNVVHPRRMPPPAHLTHH